MTRDEYDDWAYEHDEPSSWDIEHDMRVVCDECGECIEEGDEVEIDDQILCDACHEQATDTKESLSSLPPQ